MLHAIDEACGRAIGVELVLTRGTLETAPFGELFERLIGFVVGDAERIGHILHIGRAMCIHIAEHRFQVRTGRARSHATNRCIPTQWHRSNAKTRALPGNADAGAGKTDHELAHAHPERARSKKVPTFMDEHQKAEHKRSYENRE